MVPVPPRFPSWLAPVILLILVAFLAAGQVQAQAPGSHPNTGAATVPQATQDTAVANAPPGQATLTTAKDSLATAPPKSRADTVIVAKHSFNHREQIITGSVVMSCLMLMMVAMNNYNPR
ncbi:MAG: hypothetical protein JWP91_3509 [Fibrobacteres bacterium]|nr:hypothetical protein [Fibrobacterota bacterium]